MNFVSTVEALRAHFLAQWALSAYAAVPIFQVNRQTNNVGPDASWIRMTVTPGTRKAVAYGNTRIWRTYGEVIFQIFVPKGNGDGEARRYADTIGTILEGKTISGVELEAVTFRPVGDELNWAQFNVAIDYTVDEIK